MAQVESDCVCRRKPEAEAEAVMRLSLADDPFIFHMTMIHGICGEVKKFSSQIIIFYECNDIARANLDRGILCFPPFIL
jgi:hypothetical protein